MDKNAVMSTVYRNRFIIILCFVLILGTVSGSRIAIKIPEEMIKNIYMIISEEPVNFKEVFINRLCLPVIILISVYLSGNSVFGKISVQVCVFFAGLFFGFENAVNYGCSGTEYIFKSLILYFTATLYFMFFYLIMAESSLFSAIGINEIIKNTDREKSHYDAKKLTVKLVTFTIIFAIISLFSAYIFSLLDSAV